MPQFGHVKVRFNVCDLNVGSFRIQLAYIHWIGILDHDQVGRSKSFAVETLKNNKNSL